MQTRNEETAPSHINLYKGLEEAFVECLIKLKPAKTTMDHLFKKNKWGKKDRDFILDVFYKGVRWKRLIEFQLQDVLQENNIRLFTQQLVYNLYKDLPLISYFKHFKPLINSQKPTLGQEISYPEWLVELAMNDGFLEELKAMNSPSKFVIRANTLKISKDELVSKLELEGYKPSKTLLIDNAILFDKNPNLKQSQLYSEGFFEIQDFHSQQIAKLIQPKQNQLIVDACAGSGGKSLHLAAITKNKAKIIALDTRKSALAELKKRKTRAGAYSIKTAINSLYARQELLEKANILLIDAPCSGTGTIRRQPELKWHIDKHKIDKYNQLQKKILLDNCSMVINGGKLIYATCSILKQENQEVISWFLNKNKNFSLLFEKEFYPSVGYDGFYMAIMQKI